MKEFTEVSIFQDLNYKSFSTAITHTPTHLITTGLYSPSVKIHLCSTQNIKNERSLNNECIKISALTEDALKLAMLKADKSIEIHAKFGKYCNIKLNDYGRDMLFDNVQASLIIRTENTLCSFNLEEGKFDWSIYKKYKSIIRNQNCSLLVAAADKIQFIDFRTKEDVRSIDQQTTHIDFDDTGLYLNTFSEDHKIIQYDLRKKEKIASFDYKQQPCLFLKTCKSGILIGNENGVDLIEDYKNITDSIELKNINCYDVIGHFLFLGSTDYDQIKTYQSEKIGESPEWMNKNNITI